MQTRAAESNVRSVASKAAPLTLITLHIPSGLARCFAAVIQVTVATIASAQTPAAGDASRGKVLFQQMCALCHATGLGAQQAGQGPLLAGVVGRMAAAQPNFGYTRALAASKIARDAAALERFLAAPTTMVPGTNMVVAVPSPADRSDVVAFLATLHPVTIRSAEAIRISSRGDWQNDAPGVHNRIDFAQLPAPYATLSAGNAPRIAERPKNRNPSAPAGFQAKLFAANLSGSRLLRVAPNGDIFIAENRQGRIRVLRAADGAEAAVENTIFADKLSGPFGIAFYPAGGAPRWVYVANLNSVVRFPYRSGDLIARGPAETVLAKIADNASGNNTRDLGFSLDGRHMFISIGSATNVADDLPKRSSEEIRVWETTHARGSAWDKETNRANVLVCDPEGKDLRVFAAGIRNGVGLAVQPGSGEVWVSTNERDGLGDDLVPDYITRVKEGGCYGWPWYYLGDHEDPRHAGARPDLAGHVDMPDVPLQAQSAALQLTFFPTNLSGAGVFPSDYRGDIFAALHGSWNRTGRTGGKIVRVHLKNGAPTGEYEDFLTGFVIDDAQVWGRPVGVAAEHDGALLATDDANDTLWRVTYAGR